MITWPAARVGEALVELAQRSGLRPKVGEIPAPPSLVDTDPSKLGSWIVAAAGALGLETDATPIRYAGVNEKLVTAAPALLRCSDGSVLALLKRGEVLTPEAGVQRIGDEAIRAELCREAEAPLLTEVESFLEDISIPVRRRRKIRAELLGQRLAPAVVAHCWTLRQAPGMSFGRSLFQAGVPRRVAILTAAHLLQYTLWLLSWWIIGAGALSGRLDRGMVVVWALLLMTIVPVRGLITWLQGLVAISVGGLLKERLLYGALQLQPEEIKSLGVGQLLGRVIESEALESLALSGGFLALIAGIELAVSGVVLASGAAGLWHALVLALWVLFAGLLGWRYYRGNREWSEQRLWLTHDLVERMVGHRTRLVQEARKDWHRHEDGALEAYLEISEDVDRKGGLLMAVIPRGWVLVGVAALVPAFVAGSSISGLALGVGGVLLGYRAFRRLASGMWSLTGAAIAWRQVAPLFNSASRTEISGSPALALLGAPGPNQPLMEAHDISFRYRERDAPVLQKCSLKISTGDRWLMEGSSGGGKSTFASVLTARLQPESGLVLARGFDYQTLGSRLWLRRVAAAPQFHENHVLTGTFAFNLLMGHDGWMTENDLKEAESTCRELGLGPLLEKMPAGMLQMVGEGGWQLSHGEKSRLYIARALLQHSDLLIFDESFAALDPENLRLALDCVLRRASTVLVIAHP
jgi:ATP-binding cassette, subfamily B, bacterial